MKIVFMGTPEFAVASLNALLPVHEVTAVVTQPDKPVGRGKKMRHTPVKVLAMENGIEIYQPEKIKSPEFIDILKKLEADIFVVAAFGQLLSEEILTMPPYGAINVHASLLPKYRGAAPIQWAIINGESQTGITIMQMDKGLDTGPMLYKESIAIEPDETGESLHDKLADLGGGALVKALAMIEAGHILPEPQDPGLSSYAPLLAKETGKIDWNHSAEEIDRRIRGLYPWPAAFSHLDGFGTVKILAAEAIDNENGTPGRIVRMDKKAGFVVGTGNGALLIKKIQLSGRKAMDVPAFLLGNKIEIGLEFH